MVASDGRRQDGCTGGTVCLGRSLVSRDCRCCCCLEGLAVEVEVVVQETHCQLHHHFPTLVERDSAPGPDVGHCPLEPNPPRSEGVRWCCRFLRATLSFVLVCPGSLLQKGDTEALQAV